MVLITRRQYEKNEQPVLAMATAVCKRRRARRSDQRRPLTDDAFNATFVCAPSLRPSSSRLLTCSLLVLSHCCPAFSARKQTSFHATSGAACFVPTDSRSRQVCKHAVLLGRSQATVRGPRRSTCFFSQSSPLRMTDDPTSSSASTNAATDSLHIGSMSQQVDPILTSALLNLLETTH